MSETKLVASAVKMLLAMGIPAWRNNTGMAMMRGRGGRQQPVFFGMKGSGDILGCLPPDGRMLSIECKVGANKPTEHQQRFIDAINDAGGLAFVAYSLDDIESMIETETGRIT